jgi:iron complex outermembrane receptor protein
MCIMLRKVDGFAPDHDLAAKSRWRSLLSRLGFIALFSLAAESHGTAQTAQPPDKPSEQLPQVEVIGPRRPSTRPGAPGTQPGPAVLPASEAGGRGRNTTPLNTNVIAESASRLGLTPRETPATVEVIDQQTLKDRGLRTTTEAAQAAVGVTAGDAPAAPASFSMRGFTESQINTLYNGIKIGPSGMTGRIMDTGNLDRIEILKGPASLLSGEGATGGAINYVTKRPHTGKIENEAFVSYDSFHGYRAGYGSGGSTATKGLDYRFDLTRASNISFIDDTYSKLLNISGQLDYRVTNDLKIWGAIERKEDKDRFYWGTPLVPASFSGPYATKGIVSGPWTNYYLNNHTGVPSPVSIDSRTLTTTYNVLDNRSGARELWLRGGFDWDLTKNVRLKSQVYQYNAKRHWFNNEVNSFDDSGPNNVYRERLQTHHDQSLTGNITDLIVNSNIAGMDNRFAATLAASTLQFDVRQGTGFPSDTVSLVNPDRGYYGSEPLETFNTRVDNISLSFEDRLKLTPSFAVIGGLRIEEIELHRNRISPAGLLRTDLGYPLSTSFRPTTGRGGYTWEALPGLTFYSQYATAADPAVANIFILRPTQPLLLTTSRIYESGVKQLLWGNRAEWVFSAFDIERKNAYQLKSSSQTVALAGKVQSKGLELSGAVHPTRETKLWGNVAYVDAQYLDFVDVTGTSFAGKTPPNVPRVVANAGASYRFATPWPVEVGASVRHVGDRFNNDDNLVIMNAYTIADAFVFIDIPKSAVRAVDNTRITFRARNLTNRLYAEWGDPSYPDQIILGAPRSFEVAASFRW